MRNIRLVLWIAVAIGLFALGALTVGGFAARNAPAPAGSAMQPGAPLGGAFSLVDHNGQPVTESILRGKPSAVFFGFTHCPDVCPTTLMETAGWIKALGSDADKMRFVFVTVDPERDSAEALSRYVPAFDPSFIGLRGDADATRNAAREFKVFFQKVPNRDGSSYNVDHTAASYILDAEGRLRLFVRHTQPVEEIVADLRQLI